MPKNIHMNKINLGTPFSVFKFLRVKNFLSPLYRCCVLKWTGKYTSESKAMCLFSDFKSDVFMFHS